VQENEGIKNKPRRKRWSGEQIAESVREFKSNELTQRYFSENREIAARELQPSLKIVRRASKPRLVAVQIEAEERNDRGLELTARWADVNLKERSLYESVRSDL
jgi:hypothetical protein